MPSSAKSTHVPVTPTAADTRVNLELANWVIERTAPALGLETETGPQDLLGHMLIRFPNVGYCGLSIEMPSLCVAPDLDSIR